MQFHCAQRTEKSEKCCNNWQRVEKKQHECKEQQVKRKPSDDHRSNLIYWCNQREQKKRATLMQIQGNGCLVVAICYLSFSTATQTVTEIECLIESDPFVVAANY